MSHAVGPLKSDMTDAAFDHEGHFERVCSKPLIFIINSLIVRTTCFTHRLYVQHWFIPLQPLVLQHADFMPKVGVGKRGAYQLVHGDLPRQHPFGTTLETTGPMPADSRQ